MNAFREVVIGVSSTWKREKGECVRAKASKKDARHGGEGGHMDREAYAEVVTSEGIGTPGANTDVDMYSLGLPNYVTHRPKLEAQTQTQAQTEVEAQTQA